MANASQKLTSLMNIGPSVERHLREVGINTVNDLREVGYLEAYFRIRFINPKVMGNIMALYALYGALTHQNCIRLDEEVKRQLKQEVADKLTPPNS